jgi:PAS domain S-box-containing protein
VSSNDYRIFHKDGSVHWHRSSVMPVFDERGTLLSFVGNAVDFTDRKHAEDALRESRAELSSILHGSPVLQFVIDRDHRILSWNKALEEYSGIPAADAVGTCQQWRAFYKHQRPVLADLLVDNNTDGIFKWYSGKLNPSRYIEGAYEATDFFPAMGVSGTWLSFTAAPVRNAEGAIIGAVETLEDVTERIAATEALRKSEEKYRRILENMQDAYIRADESGIIQMVNPSAARMYGYGSPEEMIGIPSASLYATEEQREELLRKLEEPGGLTDFAGNALRKDGTTFLVSLNVQFVRDGEGKVQGTEGIVRDITERRTLEHAIREANRKLSLLNSITRHDIVNQLSMLQGFTQLAAKKESDPVISGYLAKVDESSGKIRRQIEFMKSYQELGAHLPGWLRLRETIAKAGTEGVACSDTCNDIEVFSDPMLEKVFFNLFENAQRHGEHVTEIHIRCERTPDGIVIIVEDDGIGIPPEEKETIFEKGIGKNTGLGLFLAKEILSITGITIRESGTPGKGAKFEIAVPNGHFRSIQ